LNQLPSDSPILQCWQLYSTLSLSPLDPGAGWSHSLSQPIDPSAAASRETIGWPAQPADCQSAGSQPIDNRLRLTSREILY